MKILYIIAQYGRNAISNRPHVELLQAWQALGVTVQVLSLVNADEHAGSEVLEGIPVERLPLRVHWLARLDEQISEQVFHYRYLLNLIPQYRAAIARHTPDLVHVESAFPHGVAVALARPTVPFALTLQGADVMNVPEFDYGYGRFGIVRRLLAWAFQRAVLVRGDSMQMRDLALQLGCPVAKACAVPYNITAANYVQPSEDLATLRTAARQLITHHHHLPASAALVLSLGRLHPFKGVEYLVQAATTIVSHCPNAHILVAGPSRTTTQFGNYADYLRTLIPDLIAGHVHVIGPVQHHLARTYFAAADVLVVPSIAEAFNRVVVEAAAVGTPSVVTATTGVADYARPFRAAVIVPPLNSHAIAQAVVPLLQNTACWPNLSEQAIQFSQQFQPTIIAKTLFDMYATVIS